MLETFLLYPLKMAFAGIWGFVFSWGLGVGLIICLLAAAYFTTAVPFIGPYLSGMRAHLLWAALGVAIFLGGHYVGASNATARCEAKQVIVDDIVDDAVAKTKTPAARGAKDKWDRPEH